VLEDRIGGARHRSVRNRCVCVLHWHKAENHILPGCPSTEKKRERKATQRLFIRVASAFLNVEGRLVRTIRREASYFVYDSFTMRTRTHE
jgi:hypothetical protein